jgi:hypothetical protein
VDPEHFTKAMESVVELTEHARKITGRQIDAWTAVMSPEVGTIVWSLWAEKIGDIEQGGDALAADSGFMKLVEKYDDLYEGPYVDGIATVVHGDWTRRTRRTSTSGSPSRPWPTVVCRRASPPASRSRKRSRRPPATTPCSR